MSKLLVPNRGKFIRTHHNKVIHLSVQSMYPVGRHYGAPKWMCRPLHYLLLFAFSTCVILPLFLFFAFVCYAYVKDLAGFVGLCGIFLLVLNRLFADKYYDWTPTKPTLRIIRR